MPSFLILASSVVGFRPSILAAPLTPLTRHPVDSITSQMCSRSISSIVRRRYDVSGSIWLDYIDGNTNLTSGTTNGGSSP